jgi:hypothetical protein
MIKTATQATAMDKRSSSPRNFVHKRLGFKAGNVFQIEIRESGQFEMKILIIFRKSMYLVNSAEELI